MTDFLLRAASDGQTDLACYLLSKDVDAYCMVTFRYSADRFDMPEDLVIPYTAFDAFVDTREGPWLYPPYDLSLLQRHASFLIEE